MIFNTKNRVFLDRLSVDCLLSDNKFVKTFNFLLLNGYTIDKTFSEEVDVIILDTCGVQQKFVDFADEKIGKYVDCGKTIIIMGCIDKRIIEKYGDNLIYIHNTSYEDVEKHFEHSIPLSSVDQKNNSNKIDQLSPGSHYTSSTSGYLYDLLKDINPVGKDRSLQEKMNSKLFEKSHIIEISTGCEFNCSYCNIKKIKGNTKSLPMDKVLEEIEREVEKGKINIFLLSDDCGSYGIDIGTNFGLLIQNIIKINDKIKIHITNIHPTFLIKYYDDIKEYIYNGNFVYMLTPTQHYSSRILKSMNRFYDREKLTEILADIKANSDTKLFNQIIFNYHSETLEEFVSTFKLLKHFDKTSFYRFSDVNNSFGKDIISQDLDKKLILLRRIQKKYNLDINIYNDNVYD